MLFMLSNTMLQTMDYYIQKFYWKNSILNPIDMPIYAYIYKIL